MNCNTTHYRANSSSVPGDPTTATKGWVDDVSTDYAINFVRSNKDKPFALVLGFKSSHGPWNPPERLKNKYARDEIKPPANTEPAIYRGWTAKGGNPNRRLGNAAVNQEMPRNYLRTLTGVDDNVGKMLKTLDDLDLADITLVVFLSDNGFYLREHQLGDKRTAYEESIRIPLLLRYPKLVNKPRTIDEMVLNLDLPSTILDLAGVQIPQEMQGRSWRPLLEGKAPPDWRKAFFYEYFYEKNFNVPTTFAVRTTTHKLIKYPANPKWTELFDIQADPYEQKNLANDPAQSELRTLLEEEFERQARAVEFVIPEYADQE